MRSLLAGAWVLLGLLQSISAQAGALELREALNLLGGEVWTQTYEGVALRERLLGRIEYGQADTEQLLERLEDPANRAVAEQLESRAAYLRRTLESGAADLGEAASTALAIAPERVSGRIEFMPMQGSEVAANYGAARQDFLAGGERREVLVYLRGEYRSFQPSILKRLEALGFSVRPNYRDSMTLLEGQAPERSLKALSGIDGVAHVNARGRSYSPASGRPGLAPLEYRRGAKALTE